MITPGQFGEETRTSVTLVVSYPNIHLDTMTTIPILQVTDVNDELPVFNRASVTVPVPEDVGTDTPLPGLSLEVSLIKAGSVTITIQK